MIETGNFLVGCFFLNTHFYFSSELRKCEICLKFDHGREDYHTCRLSILGSQWTFALFGGGELYNEFANIKYQYYTRQDLKFS